jgi:hypothetical protein
MTTSLHDEEAITSTPRGNESKQPLPEFKEEFDTSMTDDSENGLEQWNQPRINTYRYLSTLYAFIIMGMNDAAYGVSGRPFYYCLQLLTFTGLDSLRELRVIFKFIFTIH